MTPTLKAPGTKRLKLKNDEPVSNVAFKFNLRRYTKVAALQQLNAGVIGDLKTARGEAAEAREATSRSKTAAMKSIKDAKAAAGQASAAADKKLSATMSRAAQSEHSLAAGAYTRPLFGSTLAHFVGYRGGMIFPRSIRQGDTGRYDQNGLG